MNTYMNSRVDNLERAALEFEGAQFAIRHILANLLSRLDRHDAEECLRELQFTGRGHGIELGDARLKGYLSELDEVKAFSGIANDHAVKQLRLVR
ncbi:hypothetical protein EDF58_1244 [Novosphingobium sp. PhB57]|nr:hypothetical protein EDF58_1244 [Novosphingobium sp. PhB57]